MSNSTDILVIAVRERNEKTGCMETIVSHGVDLVSGENVVLPNLPPAEVGAVWAPEVGEYVIRGVAQRTVP